VRTAETSIEEAQATGHALSLCHALALAACPIALWAGNLTTAAHYAGMLVEHSRKHCLEVWSAHGFTLQKAVVLMGGDIDAGSQPLDTNPRGNRPAQSQRSVFHWPVSACGSLGPR
jgi:hypothetical protein